MTSHKRSRSKSRSKIKKASLSKRSRSKSRSKNKEGSGERSFLRIKLIKIVPSVKKDKKYDAHFSDGTVTHFGARGYSDFTIHKDRERRRRYIQRHSANENFDAFKTAGSLSLWILWGPSTSLKENIRFYKKRFNL